MTQPSALRGEGHSLLAGRSLRDQYSPRCRRNGSRLQRWNFTDSWSNAPPGHTVLDDKIYSKGMVDFKRDIADAIAKLDYLNDPLAFDKRENAPLFDIACDAGLFLPSARATARELAAKKPCTARAELNCIAEVCTRVPRMRRRIFTSIAVLLVLHLASSRN